jgi:predicted ATP-grasp superfamily ATP-dependent carboligase
MRALVMGCTRNAGLAVVRALAGVVDEVIGVDDRRMPGGLRSRHADAYDHFDAGENADSAAGLIRMTQRHSPQVVFPMAHARRVLVDPDAAAVRAVSLLPDLDAYLTLTDKARLYAQCQTLGVPAPRVLRADEARHRFTGSGADEPCTLVVKSRLDVGGGRATRFVRSEAELSEATRQLMATWGEIVITEYIPGPENRILAVELLFDRDSHLIGWFARDKLRLQPPRVGVSAVARSVHVPELVGHLLQLFRSVGWVGPAEVELKRDERDGRLKILEVNGRFSGAIGYAVEAGVNLPARYVEAVRGERPEVGVRPEFPEGLICVDWARLLASVSGEIRAGRNALAVLRQVAGEIRGQRLPAAWRWNDPVPTLGKWVLELRAFLGETRGRWSGGRPGGGVA